MSFELFNTLLFVVFFLLLISSVFFMLIRFRRLEKYVYISVSIVCILLAMFRPIDVARDSKSYEYHIENTCKITECGFKQNIDYDIGYFFLLSISKVFFSNYQALLFIAGVVLAVKLFLIARMTSYSVLSLYFYYSLFFLYHDITQARVSAASAFFLLALYLMDRNIKKMGVAAYGAAMMTHYQAIVAPLAQLANSIIARKYWLAITLILISQVAIIAQLVPPASAIIKLFPNESYRNINVENIFFDVSIFELKGTNSLIIMLLAMTVFPLQRMVVQKKIFGYCFSSVIVGFMFYWFFAVVPVVSDRILQFFWVPLVVLVSLGINHKPTYLLTIFVGANFFMLSFYIAPILES